MHQRCSAVPRWVRRASIVLAVLAGAVAAPAAAQAQAGSACNAQFPKGQTTVTLTSGGVERVVVVYVPSVYNGRLRLPLVLDLHGSSSTAAEQAQRSNLARTAEQKRFVVAEPQGLLPAGPPAGTFRWNVPGVTTNDPNAPDDEQFLTDVIDYMVGTLCVDPTRVYGAGYSGGGRMISQYACDHADRVAAIAPVAGLRAGVPATGPNGPQPDPASCNPSRPVPVVTFSGTADPVNPYPGGGAPYWQYGVEAAQARWAELNGCERGPKTTRVKTHVYKVAFYRCEDQAWVVLYRVVGGGHTWPGSRTFIPLEPFLGHVNLEIDASAIMWSFFRHYRLPAVPAASPA